MFQSVREQTYKADSYAELACWEFVNEQGEVERRKVSQWKEHSALEPRNQIAWVDLLDSLRVVYAAKSERATFEVSREQLKTLVRRGIDVEKALSLQCLNRLCQDEGVKREIIGDACFLAYMRQLEATLDSNGGQMHSRLFKCLNEFRCLNKPLD